MELGPGIPRMCTCGAVTIFLTSKTKENPGRKFYRCGAVFGGNHVFKWADEAIAEEIEVMAGKHSVLEQEVVRIKEEIAEIKTDISEIVALLDKLASKIRM